MYGKIIYYQSIFQFYFIDWHLDFKTLLKKLWYKKQFDIYY